MITRPTESLNWNYNVWAYFRAVRTLVVPRKFRTWIRIVERSPPATSVSRRHQRRLWGLICVHDASVISGRCERIGNAINGRYSSGRFRQKLFSNRRRYSPQYFGRIASTPFRRWGRARAFVRITNGMIEANDIITLSGPFNGVVRGQLIGIVSRILVTYASTRATTILWTG